MTKLISPHGGALKLQIVNDNILQQWQDKLLTMKSLILTQHQLCDLEMIINGGFSPLDGFMTSSDYESVLDNMRLDNGLLWPIPITLDVKEEFSCQLKLEELIVLRNLEGNAIAAMRIDDIWKPNKLSEAQAVFDTQDVTHPGVAKLLQSSAEIYIGGKVYAISSPKHYDFLDIRKTPAELRDFFETHNWHRVVAFQTRNPMHRAHQELTMRAAAQCNANLLIHPVVGKTKPGDIDYYVRVRCYKKLLQHYPPHTTLLSLLPIAMRMAGPREALWHAIIRKNYGCTHFIVGRDHAGPGKNSKGDSFYGLYDAQKLLAKYQSELGIQMVPFQEMVYVRERDSYLPVDQVRKNETVLKISGTEFRQRLQKGLNIPHWFSYPEIITELQSVYPPLPLQGFTIFFTGLSGAGKSTIANALLAKLNEIGGRQVTLLDGDLVRKNLSSELGFSREHRDLNIKRIAFVATEITKNRGIAICAQIAPYAQARMEARRNISAKGGFIEVYVSTPLEVCEQRDTKGLYAKARAGLIDGFTGINDPYEAPENADLTINTDTITLTQAVQCILDKLETLGYFATKEQRVSKVPELAK